MRAFARSGATSLALFLILLASGITAQAQVADVRIDWEIANRFRLFKHQGDFDEQARAVRANDGSLRSIFDTERVLSDAATARGWAAPLLSRLCYDAVRGRIIDKCNRDGVTESYLNSKTERVKFSVRLSPAFAGATCIWTIGTGAGAKTANSSCASNIEQRVQNATPTTVRVVARSPAGQVAEDNSVVAIRDLLVVGIGDSIASGEGNPVIPVELSDQGFCFRRLFIGTKFYLPGRADFGGSADCPQSGGEPGDLDAWNSAGARWLYDSCHRSLYGYQTRLALTLAIQNKDISVTYLPLGCSGATIKAGMLGSQKARERRVGGANSGPKDVEGQISQLQNYLRNKNSKTLFRKPDLILLTIGANDIEFSGLVANTIVAEDPERGLLAKVGMSATPERARTLMNKGLKRDFGELRKALVPFVDSSLSRVVYTTYGNPGVSNGGAPCGESRIGFDAHPAFSVNKDKIAATVRFVEDEFVPMVMSLATCTPAAGCSKPAQQTMTYVDGHRASFADHGFCALAEQPDFDRKCFLNGDSFQGMGQGLEKPMKCDLPASSFRTYAKRSRWIRTVNDSFFAAMTYSWLGAALSPPDIHDGVWGLVSVVYGGAMHPTAEGHAAMADAAISPARTVLGLPSPPALVAVR